MYISILPWKQQAYDMLNVCVHAMLEWCLTLCGRSGDISLITLVSHPRLSWKPLRHFRVFYLNQWN